VRKGDDVYHFPTYPPFSSRAGLKAVWTVHDLTWWRFPETSSRLGKTYYPQLARAAASNCTITTDSHAIRAEIVDALQVPAERVSVIYPAVTQFDMATEALLENRSQPSRRPYVLTVGTIEPRKNLKKLLEGFRASGLSKDFDLLAVGRFGWGEDVPGLKVLSGLSDAELWRAYRGASAFISASIYEGFGFPLLEAASRGVPIACSDIPVYREVLESSHIPAVYFDPHDVESIAHSLKEVVRRPHLNPAMAGLLSRSWEAVADEMLALYQSL
jgi:glycosyltransferase involved in cell wall biosynthesis